MSDVHPQMEQDQERGGHGHGHGGDAEAEGPFSPAQQMMVARKVARKAVNRKADTGVADSLGAAGGATGDKMENAGESTPAELAEDGFSGTAREIPHRKKMEQSFGQDFGHIRAYTDDKAKGATNALGAHAYAMGDQIAFEKENPDEATVAHELTHVMQHTGQGPARKAASGSEDGIDMEGEPEAEAVEAAVGSGKPARSVWTNKEEEGQEQEGAQEAQAQEAQAQEGAPPKSAGPARKAKGPAKDSKFTMGMSFSPSSLEKSYEYMLWDKGPPPIPIAAVPGLFFTIEPSVRVKAAGGVDWKDKSLKTNVGVEGGLLVGFTYGNKELAALYGGIEGKVAGGFEYTKSNDSWKLEGGIKLGSNFTIGCRVGGGILDYKFDFGKVDPICTFGGLKWEKGKPFQSGWFEWGQQVQEFFAAMNRTVTKAKQVLAMGADAARNAYNAAANTAKATYKTGADVINWVTSW